MSDVRRKNIRIKLHWDEEENMETRYFNLPAARKLIAEFISKNADI